MKRLQKLLPKIRKLFLVSNIRDYPKLTNWKMNPETTYYKSPIGIAKIIGDENGIQSISIVDHDAVSEELLQQEVPQCLQECVVQLNEYFNKERASLT